MAKNNKGNNTGGKPTSKGIVKNHKIGDGVAKGANTNLPKFEFKPKTPSKK